MREPRFKSGVRYRLPGWILGVALSVAGIGMVVNLDSVYVEWATFDRSGSPPRIEWCSRRYYPVSPPLSAPEFAQVSEPRPWTRILTTPSGEPALTVSATADEKAKYGTDVCAMILFVKESPDRHLKYSLSGGP